MIEVIGVINGNIHAATIFPTKFAGAARQEPLSEVQVDRRRGGNSPPAGAGGNRMVCLASAAGSAVSESPQMEAGFNLSLSGPLTTPPRAAHPRAARLTVKSLTLIFSVSDRQSEGDNATLERVLLVWRRCPGW